MPVNKLLTFTQKPNTKTKNEAFLLLAKYGNSSAVIPLMSELAASTADSRFKIALVLGEIGDPRAINILIESLKGRYDSDSTWITAVNQQMRARAAAAKALGKFGKLPYFRRDPRATQALIESGLQDLSLVVGYSAEALGLIGDKIAVEPLLKILDNYEEIDTIEDDLTVNRRWDGSTPTVSGKAIEALVKIGDKRAVDSLVNMLEYGHPEREQSTYWPCGDKNSLSWALKTLGWVPDTEKRRALYLLNKWGIVDHTSVLTLSEEEFTKWGSSAINPLCQLLVHPHHLVCINAAKMLEKVGDTSATKPLVEITKTTENMHLQRAAIKAIAKIDISTLYKFLEENASSCKEAIMLIGDAKVENIEIPDKIIEKLIEFIGSSEKDIREAAIQTIGKLGSTSAVKPLIKFVEQVLHEEDILSWSNTNHYSYKRAIGALGDIGDKKALDILLKVKKKHGQNYQIDSEIVFALKNLGHEFE